MFASSFLGVTRAAVATRCFPTVSFCFSLSNIVNAVYGFFTLQSGSKTFALAACRAIFSSSPRFPFPLLPRFATDSFTSVPKRRGS